MRMRSRLAIAMLALGIGTSISSVLHAQEPAEPSIGQVYYTAKSGDFPKAKQMIGVVLRSHPQSAFAHYIAAEVYAMAGEFATAEVQLNASQAIDPNSKFVAPDVLQALQSKIAKGLATATPALH
jgi:uncharacterized protein